MKGCLKQQALYKYGNTVDLLIMHSAGSMVFLCIMRIMLIQIVSHVVTPVTLTTPPKINGYGRRLWHILRHLDDVPRLVGCSGLHFRSGDMKTVNRGWKEKNLLRESD